MSETQEAYTTRAPEWVPCPQAATLIRAGRGYGALDALIDRLRSGAIEAVARRAIIGREPVGVGSFIEDEAHPDWPVPREFWADGAYQKFRTRWNTGDFASQIEPRRSLSDARRGVKREYIVTELQGVRFRRDQLEAEFDLATAAPPAPPAAAPAPPAADKPRHPGGRPPKEEWSFFWYAVLRLSQEGRLNKGAFTTQDKLREELIEMMPAGALAESTIEPVVSQIWRLFVDPQ